MVNPKTNSSNVETDLFLKIGNCYTKLSEHSSAISWVFSILIFYFYFNNYLIIMQLEKIPAPQRTLAINMQLARLHHANGAKYEQ